MNNPIELTQRIGLSRSFSIFRKQTEGNTGKMNFQNG